MEVQFGKKKQLKRGKPDFLQFTKGEKTQNSLERTGGEIQEKKETSWGNPRNSGNGEKLGEIQEIQEKRRKVGES